MVLVFWTVDYCALDESTLSLHLHNILVTTVTVESLTTSKFYKMMDVVGTRFGVSVCLT